APSSRQADRSRYPNTDRRYIVCRSAPESGKDGPRRCLKACEDRAGHHIVVRCFNPNAIYAVFESVYRHALPDRIHDPVLLDAATGIDIAFCVAVVEARTWGEHFDTEIGRAFDDISDDVHTFGANEENVRLDDGIRFQDHVHRCPNNSAKMM